MWTSVRWVAQKELREILRDQRTLLVMILLPVLLYPILCIGSVLATASQLRKLEARTYLVWVEDLDALPPELRRLLEPPEDDAPLADDAPTPGSRGTPFRIRLELSAPPPGVDYDQALSDGDVSAVVRGAADLERVNSEDGEAPTIEVLFNGSIDASSFAARRVLIGVDDWRTHLVHERLARAGLPRTVLQPVRGASSDRGPPGAIMARLLTALLVILALTGAYYPALDLGAGEKERGTLETLLLAPVPRVAIALGKYLAVSVVAMVAALLNLLSLGITFSSFAAAMPTAEMALELEPAVLLAMLLVLLPLVALFSALSLAVSTFAASYKEGQAYLTPLLLLGMLPAMATAFPGVRLTPPLCLVPGVGAALLLKELLAHTANAGQAVLVILSSLAYAGLAVRWVASLYEREEVLWRPAAAGAPDLLGLRGPPAGEPGQARTPDLPQAVALAMFVLLLAWFAGQRVQGWSLTAGLLGTLVGLVLLPTGLYARILRCDWRATFSLGSPRALGWVAALLLGVGAAGLSLDLLGLQRSWFGELTADERQALAARMGEILTLSLPVILLLMAALPALVEELCFRGFVISGLRREGGLISTITVSSLLFALVHLDPGRLLPQFVVGVWLALLVIRTGSIWTAMVAHALHNGLLVTLQHQALTGALDQADFLTADGAPLGWVRAVAWACLLIGLGLLWVGSPPAAQLESAPGAADG
jgi:sodium transport system permease protein